MGIEGSLTPDTTSLFAYFTVDSNLLLMVVSIPILIFEILMLKNKRDNIPSIIYILKYIGTCAVALTFATIAFIFVPMFGLDFWKLYTNNNLIFHLVVPVISIITVIFFENEGINKFKQTFLGIIPAGIYAIYYTINVYAHMRHDGTVPPEYDIYNFTAAGEIGIIISFIGMLLLAYLMAFLIYLFANIVRKRKKKIE